MATIRGTLGSDWLYGTIESDVIFGLAGDDHIEDYCGGNNTIYGHKGNDYILSLGQGYDQLFGGIGNDTVLTYGGDAYGQGGNDEVYASRTGVGGLGSDHVYAVYETDPLIKNSYIQLFGDNIGNLRKGGDDTLTVFTANQDYVRMTGGAGHDTFEVETVRLDGYGTLTEVMDFKDGIDKLSIENHLYSGDGQGPSTSQAVFDNLDRYDDNVLNASDAMFGSPITSDPTGNSITFAVGDDWVKVNGISQIDTSDWLLYA